MISSNRKNKMQLIRRKIMLKVDGWKASFNSFIRLLELCFKLNLIVIIVVKKFLTIFTPKNMLSHKTLLKKITISKSIMIHPFKCILKKDSFQDYKNYFHKLWDFSIENRRLLMIRVKKVEKLHHQKKMIKKEEKKLNHRNQRNLHLKNYN